MKTRLLNMHGSNTFFLNEVIGSNNLSTSFFLMVVVHHGTTSLNHQIRFGGHKRKIENATIYAHAFASLHHTTVFVIWRICPRSKPSNTVSSGYGFMSSSASWRKLCSHVS